MNDKRDLGLGLAPMMEWCARYGGLGSEDEGTNWELYIGDKIVAYNYDVIDGYISKYSTMGHFPFSFRLNVVYDQTQQLYNITKKHV